MDHAVLDAMTAAPRRQRADGGVSIEIACIEGRSRVMRRADRGASRVRMPNTAGPRLEATLLNVAGGIACGDRFAVSASLDPGAELAITTPGAERVYRSDGPVACVSVALSIGAGASLHWLPQEMILFDGARLSRRFEAEVDAAGTLLICEMLVLGRQARAERIAHGLVDDRWMIRRGGRLLHAEAVRFEGPMSELMDRPAIGAGAVAMGTVLLVSPQAEAMLEPLRDRVILTPEPRWDAPESLDQTGARLAASAWDGRLVVRALAPTIEALRRALLPAVEFLSGAELPRTFRS